MRESPSDMDREVLRASLPEIVAEMERYVPYASILVTSSDGLTIRINHRERQVEPADPRQGAVLTAWCGDHVEEWATTALDPDRLWREAREFLRTVHVAQTDLRVDPGEPLVAEFATPVQVDPRTVPLRDKFAQCQEEHARLAALDRRILNAEVRLLESRERKLFANRHRLLSQEVHRIRYFLLLVVHEDGKTAYHWHTKDGTGGLEIARVSEEKRAELRDVAVALLRAGRVEPGYYDCVASPSVAGTIAHEAFGHGVEMDMFLKGRARAAQYVGKQVASPLVSILDDPTVEGAYGSYFVDDEGHLAQPTYIIREGVFERGLTDLYSATRLAVVRTANGRRESFARKVYPRMSNTYFARGETPVEAILQSVDRGIYLDHLSSGMEDPKNWGLQVTAHIGREIVGGRFTGRLFSPVGITGYVPDVLQSISLVGDDFALSGGWCGKGHKEFVPVSDGGPHFRFRARLG
ncbi:MAG: TldD/PmbA family protein [Anaerolineae bacterium]